MHSLWTDAAEMESLWKKHLHLHKSAVGKMGRERMKKGEGSFWVKPERGDKKYRDRPWKGLEVKHKGKTMWGTKHRYRYRIQDTFREDKLDQPLRRTVETGADHAAVFLFDEMKKQHRVPGEKRARFVFPVRKGFTGARYKVTTRIGGVHHANVNNPLFADVNPIAEPEGKYAMHGL